MILEKLFQDNLSEADAESAVTFDKFEKEGGAEALK